MNSLTRSSVPEGKPHPSQKLPATDGISAMLASYQQTVRLLLDQDDCAGASVEELELFKSQFRTSAYTCRLGSCPRATLGFTSEQLRLEHEMAHMRFRCTFPGCQYPFFISTQALKKHVNKYHNCTPTRKSIRKIGHIPTDQSRSTAGTPSRNRNSVSSGRPQMSRDVLSSQGPCEDSLGTSLELPHGNVDELSLDWKVPTNEQIQAKPRDLPVFVLEDSPILVPQQDGIQDSTTVAEDFIDNPLVSPTTTSY
jgi:hypothetical protein